MPELANIDLAVHAAIGFLLSRPYAKVCICAPTQESVETEVWPAIDRWIERTPEAITKHLKRTDSSVRFNMDFGILLLGVRAADDGVEAFMGWIAQNVMLIAYRPDEIPADVYALGAGCIESPSTVFVKVSP